VRYAESIGALAELQRAGKIRHIGVSNVTVAQLTQARAIVPVVSVQNRYNFEDRSSERVLDACTQDGLAFLPWAPVGGASPLREKTIARLARGHNATGLQIALAWLLKRSPVMLPIPARRRSRTSIRTSRRRRSTSATKSSANWTKAKLNKPIRCAWATSSPLQTYHDEEWASPFTMMRCSSNSSRSKARRPA